MRKVKLSINLFNIENNRNSAMVYYFIKPYSPYKDLINIYKY